MLYSYSDVVTLRTDEEMALDISRLVELRKKRGWKESDLAHAIGITQQTLSRYETGKRQPPADVLVKMADVLETSTDYLLGQAPGPRRSSGLTDDEWRVVNDYRNRRLALENKIVNEEISELVDPLRNVVKGIIARVLKAQGIFDNRRDNP